MESGFLEMHFKIFESTPERRLIKEDTQRVSHLQEVSKLCEMTVLNTTFHLLIVIISFRTARRARVTVTAQCTECVTTCNRASGSTTVGSKMLRKEVQWRLSTCWSPRLALS